VTDVAADAPALLTGTGAPLRVRWLGRVPYLEAWDLQRAFAAGDEDRLLLLEHPPTFTLGRNAEPSNVVGDPADVGATLVHVDRGGDVTYHGPGQLVAYPLLTLPTAVPGGLPDTRAWVATLEQVVVDAVTSLGLVGAARREGYPGVWLDVDGARPRKLAAVGVRIERGRTLHGFALNVDPDLSHFGQIVPCGITDAGVTSLVAEGLDVDLQTVAGAVVDAFVARWAPSSVERSDVVWKLLPEDLTPFSRGDRDGNAGTSVRLQGRLAQAGVTEQVELSARKPEWMRAPVRHHTEVLGLRSTLRELDLVTVCEEAGCPNLSECWSEGTATFMVNGERCTRACGFCLVDTRKPEAQDADEPARVAEAVVRMDLEHAVVTTVARDDLSDGGAGLVADTVRAIRDRRPGTAVEVLISDCAGDAASLQLILDARPDVVNHNIETVARLQRAARPSAGYARSLTVLARSAAAGLTTKSGLVVGMGETKDEIAATLADLAAVGVSIVTVGQYLRPTAAHLPVANWWTPEDFEEFARIGESFGIAHVESSPFTRSSYHARSSAEAAAAAGAQH
jgi:lipoic acid synthetase